MEEGQWNGCGRFKEKKGNVKGEVKDSRRSSVVDTIVFSNEVITNIFVIFQKTIITYARELCKMIHRFNLYSVHRLWVNTVWPK